MSAAERLAEPLIRALDPAMKWAMFQKCGTCFNVAEPRKSGGWYCAHCGVRFWRDEDRDEQDDE